MSREIRLFWSGGWDSTFRLLQLSRVEGLVIRPLYIRDHARLGMPYELAAMRDILPQVRSIARARVLDVDLYDRSAIYRDFPNERVSEAYGRLAEEFGLGYQYELLGNIWGVSLNIWGVSPNVYKRRPPSLQVASGLAYSFTLFGWHAP